MAKGGRHDLKGKGKQQILGRGREKTRSKRPTLIDDPEQEERILSAQLREAGLYAANILGDGNCLFRALSDQLYGSPSMHLALRHEICDYLFANPDKYRFFVDEDSVKGGFEGHVREMRQPGTYGTNIELSAFVARYRRPVKVYQPNLVYVLPVEDGPPPSPEPSTSGSPPPSSPAPPDDKEDRKLSAREKRLKAREERDRAKGKPVKGKGKQRENAQWTPPEPQAFDGTPLCIVYHSWEHYSSLRNLDGPHTGPPRLRVARVESPHPADEPDAKSVDGEEHEADGVDEIEDMDMTGEDAPIPTAPAGEPPPHPPQKPAHPRVSRDTDARALPSVRAALAKVKADATSSLAPPPSHAFHPSLLPSLPPLPPSPNPSSSPPTPAGHSGRASPRPPKHALDRTSISLSRPRSPSASSSSSSSGATSPLHPDELAPTPSPAEPEAEADADVDENDNDSLHRRLRARHHREQRDRPRERVEQSPALSTSTVSTGVASASSGYSGGSGASNGTQASSPPDSGTGKEVVNASSRHPLSQDEDSDSDAGFGNVDEDDDEDEVVVAPPPSAKTRTSKPRHERRGPTAAEKKEAARQRRMERRGGKGVEKPVLIVAEKGKRKTRGGKEEKEKENEGRVLRSGKRTGGGAPGGGDAGLSQVRELYI
ncbi:hypothetical protein JCM11251_007856 [Rhodosporidiobolus azoricus]